MRGHCGAFLVLIPLASCVSTAPEPEVVRKKSWRFEEVTLGTEVEELAAGAPQDLTPGLHPDLYEKKRMMLPGRRIRHPDGRIELILYVPHVGDQVIAKHYVHLVKEWCKAYAGAGGPEVLFSDDPKAIDGVTLPARAVELKVLNTADKVYASKKMLRSFGNFRAFPTYDYAKTEPLTDAISALGHVDDIDAFEAFVQHFIVDVDQVEIEAMVVEAGVTDLTDFGALTKITPTSPNQFFQGLETEFDNESGLGGILVLKGIQDALELDTTLRLLKERREVDLSANPRIVLRNGGTAALVRGDSVPVQTVVSVSPNNLVSAGITYQNVGLQLRVTAFAFGRDAVFLDLQVQSGNISGFTSIGSVTNPLITNRMARTSVILKQGETLVVGGLMTKQVEQRESKVPLLGDIPLLGMLFRSSYDAETTSEVQFLFTPKVLRSQFDVDPIG